jgi:hypothetical protein
MWRNGVDVDIARAAIYELVGASANPVVTNGDCNISCDGTFGRQFDGTYITTTTNSTTTTTTTSTTIPESSSNNLQSTQLPIANGNENGANSSSGTLAETTTTTISYVVGAAIPESTSFSSAQTNQKTLSNCAEVNKQYPWGVAKTISAAKKQKNYRVNNPYVSKSLYITLIKMDRDKDLTVCEK